MGMMGRGGGMMWRGGGGGDDRLGARGDYMHL